MQIKDLNQINTTTTEGRYLMAALAKITTESQRDKTPYEVLDQLEALSQEMYPDVTKLEYTTSDLVSFGNYMVSEERQKLYATHPDYPNREMLLERLSQVHHADIENWKEKRKGGGK